jgi:hypothetical protein
MTGEDLTADRSRGDSNHANAAEGGIGRSGVAVNRRRQKKDRGSEGSEVAALHTYTYQGLLTGFTGISFIQQPPRPAFWLSALLEPGWA